MLDIFEIENDKTIQRYNKRQERIARWEGEGSTDGGLVIVDKFLEVLLQTLTTHIQYARSSQGTLKGLVPHLLQLDPQLISLCALQTTLHSIGSSAPFGETIRALGSALEGECFRAGLTKYSRRLAADISLKAKAARGSTNAKRAAARRSAAKAGFKMPAWNMACIVSAGGWLLDWLINTLPDVFVVIGEGEFKTVGLTEGALEIAQAATNRCAVLRRVYMPKEHAPDDWKDYTSITALGPNIPDRYNIIRTYSRTLQGAVKAAIRDGSMRPCIDGLNALQSVAWRVNTKIFDVQLQCAQKGLKVDGLPANKLQHSKLEKPWDDLDHTERWFHMRRKIEVDNHNQTVTSDWLLFEEDCATAEMFIDKPFWTPMSLDWRGRVYSVPGFNYQREDRVRGLFLFDQGEPLGEEGLRWLMTHTANCWAGPISDNDPRKTDKVSLDEREAWTIQNLDKIIACATSPLTELWWTSADAPWCFLAACFEVTAALTATSPEQYVCRLPVSFDGSCSGIQHLAAMTRAPEGSLVNLLPNSQPVDVYSTVAKCAQAAIERDAAFGGWPPDEEWKGEVARLALAYGIDRKVAKRNTMTWAYSSKRYGMGAQQQEDLMDTLAHRVLIGELPTHPFEAFAWGSKERPGKAARYLGSVMYDAIESVMSLPGEAMHFLQGITDVLADAGKYTKWVSPSGVPCINCYPSIVTEKLTLYLHINGVRRRNQTLVTTGPGTSIRKEKAVNGIAPNFVHSHDAAHMHLTARAAAAEGIQMAAVHDSFGCLPSRATRLNQIIREQFVLMYAQHDVLAEVLEQASCALTDTNRERLPKKLEYGDLDLNQVREAKYAFA